jgi:hypothetical protein
VPLRPLGFSEILDGAFQAIRTNPRTMLGFAAVVLSISSLLSLVPQAWAQRSMGQALSGAVDRADLTAFLDATLAGVVAVIPSTILVWLAVVVLNALLVVAVSAAVLGEKTSPGQLWRRVRRRVPAAIGLSLLTGLLVSVGAIVAAGLFIGPAVLLFTQDVAWAGVILVILGVFAGIAVGLTLGVGTALAGPVLLLEESSVLTALRRSWRLVRGSFWRVLAIMIVVGILTYVTSLLVQTPFTAVSYLVDSLLDNQFHTKWVPTLLSTAINTVGQTVSGAILNPWSAAVVALLYIDLRMRREGLDLELIRASEARPST